MTRRTERLDSELRKEISAVLSGPLKDRDPRISGIISVTEVAVSPDLKTAKVYVSVFGGTEEKNRETFAILRENAGFVRRELARVMRTRTVPELDFLTDNSFEYGAKMDKIFSRLHKDEE